MDTPELILYFDGNCAFCAAEMDRLRTWDTARRLKFIDIAAPGFNPEPLGVTMEALNRELHSLTAAGTLLVGIDSMLAAYTLVGKDWLVFPLRLKFLRPILADLYRRFARNRYRISRWLGYQSISPCSNGVCRTDNPFLKR